MYDYENTRWFKQGLHTKGYSERRIGIAFIGTFVNDIPPQRQLAAAKAIIKESLIKGCLDQNYELFGQQQLSSWGTHDEVLYNIILYAILSNWVFSDQLVFTSSWKSPGETLYHIINTWPHWSSEF